MILDRDDRLIYASRERNAAQTAVNAYLDGRDGYLSEIKENTLSGFRTLVSISTADLNGISRYVRVMTPLILVGSVLVSTLLAFLITGMINRPLKKLKYVVENLKDGERIAEDFDEGEIGQVGNALKRTIDNNLELRERLIQSRLKEREAELLLLQSQINPHFLYNTLDSIYCKAMIHRQDEIAAMVLALSNLFKVSLNKGKYGRLAVGWEIDGGAASISVCVPANARATLILSDFTEVLDADGATFDGSDQGLRAELPSGEYCFRCK